MRLPAKKTECPLTLHAVAGEKTELPLTPGPSPQGEGGFIAEGEGGFQTVFQGCATA